MALSWQSIQTPSLANITTPTGGGSFAGLASSGIARLQSASLYGKSLDWENDDDFEMAANQSIVISGKNKGSVTGYLSEGVKLTGQSDWEQITSNSMVNTIYKLIETVDTTQQMGFVPSNSGSTANSAGISYIQPWASRKFWKGSKPFTTTIPFNLVSITNAKTDVYDKAVTLLSFCYPRDLANTVTTFKDAVSNLKIGEKQLFLTQGTGTDGKPNLVNSLTSAIKSWAIPGPSLTYGGENDQSKGDAVTISIGNLFVFGACYVNQVNLEFSSTLDNNGYPLWCKCSISFDTMESNYCSSDGKLYLNKIPDNQAALANLLSSIANTGQTLVTDFINHEKALWNALIH